MNVLVYVHDDRDPTRKAAARAVIDTLVDGWVEPLFSANFSGHVQVDGLQIVNRFA